MINTCVFFAVFLVFVAVGSILKKKNFLQLKNGLPLKICSYLLIAVFVVRYFCIDKGSFIYKCNVRMPSVSDDYINGLGSFSRYGMTPAYAFFSILSDYLSLASFLIVVMNVFFNESQSKIVGRYLVPVAAALNVVFMNGVQTYLTNGEVSGVSVFTVFLAIETAIELVFCVNEWVCFFEKGGYKAFSLKNKTLRRREVLSALVFLLVALLATMPGYFIMSVFGALPMSRYAIDLSSTHRIYIYLAFIIPVLLYIFLNGKSQEKIRFYLIFISVGCMLTFSCVYSYKTFTDVSGLPFHLCITAMYIVPLCLIFKMKRLFYFTYFINVLGAFLAMLTPNYNEKLNPLSFTVVNFWVNHWCAFFFPLVCVALGEFARPDKKSFGYSMIAFAVYYVFVLFLNVYFTAHGKEVDYFFINSDFIADKLGTWAETLYKGTLKFTINGYEYVLHPLYQILFYLVYIGLGLGMWFLYELFFKVAENHIALSLKLKKIKLDEFALKVALDGRSEEEPMDNTAGVKLKLEHFSKRYGSNKHYAVHDTNLEVNGGEIFGFLGPNGAGKSTTIKSIVGIQPITEGRISVCGYDCARQSVQAKRLIGFVPDHYALYERLTGREYINYIADIYGVSQEERDERIGNYIKLFEMEKSIDNQIKTYSHGMKQKITIMSALVHEPKLWILDEPLTGLDPESIFQVKECMRRHAEKGNIVFFSSHIIDVVEKLCDRIAIMKGGVLQCVKTIEEVERECSLEDYYLKTIGSDDLIGKDE